MKNQKGVTLIALVITIIVLLILAGVSIAMLTGQNGLLSKANSSNLKTIAGEAKEAARLAISSTYTNMLRVDASEEFDLTQHLSGYSSATTLPTGITDANLNIVNEMQRANNKATIAAGTADDTIEYTVKGTKLIITLDEKHTSVLSVCKDGTTNNLVD